MSDAALLSDAVRDYLAMRQARYGEATVKNDAQILRRFTECIGRDVQVRNLRPEQVEAWFYGQGGLTSPHVTRDRIKRLGVQASTFNNYRSRLAQFFGYCGRRGLTRADLLAQVKPLPETKKVRMQPDVRELFEILDKTVDPRDRALLATAMNTALRAGELARLKVGDVDLVKGTLRVWISKSRIEDDMPITSDLDAELRKWLVAYAQGIKRPLEGTDHLFPSATGPRYRWRTLEDGTRESYHVQPTLWDPCKPATKLHRIAQASLGRVDLPTKDEGIHTFRRAAARHYYDVLTDGRGHDGAIRVVMAFLHHSNAQTTEHYLGISGERRSRDESLRGRSFLSRPGDDNVVSLRERSSRSSPS